MIPADQLHVAVSLDAPQNVEDPDTWRRADIVVAGNVVSTGFSRGRKADFTQPIQERAIEGEAIALAWHYLTPLVEVRRAP